MPMSESEEHVRTQKALDRIASWAKGLAAGKNPDGGENIAFGLTRQGGGLILDSFFGGGDCTPFVASGKRGVLHSQPPPAPPASVYFVDSSNNLVEVPITLTVDLNSGVVTVQGTFPSLPPKLEFKMEFLKQFDGESGDSILFYSDTSKDNAGYVIDFTLVASS
ncbi:MAG TPA: hypothetical protein VMU33_03295 [Burkholderiaceae bacterium]|nr:hypothetical protein [Burkholderiaceae bacterium]